MKGYLNDLWKYNGATWTFMKGSTAASTSDGGETYGVSGVTADTNLPSRAAITAGWVDAKGALWMYGGKVACYIVALSYL